MNTVIHIGFPKTGTTTQQEHLFSKHFQIEYLGKPYSNPHFQSVILNLVMQESLHFDFQHSKKVILDHVTPLERLKKIFLISEELFVSASKARDKGIVAQRIKDIFFPCKILITIRNQFDILKSAYINGGRLLKHALSPFNEYAISFNDWLEISTRNLSKSFIGNVDYYPTIKYYSDLFGKGNICVLLFEDFRKNQKIYLNELTQFLGIDYDESVRLLEAKHENIRIKQSTLDYERLRTQFFPVSRLSIISKILKSFCYLKTRIIKDGEADVDFPRQWVEWLSNFYQAGNRNLISEYKLPLDEYGYPV
ncbi:MAG: sulfotransferase domain-containing protein [Candidatus Aminicenantes bacterium]|nr:MAG: sulfotransferase domain-containing protein [Candidatus Aminicenantes bacterium]